MTPEERIEGLNGEYTINKEVETDEGSYAFWDEVPNGGIYRYEEKNKDGDITELWFYDPEIEEAWIERTEYEKTLTPEKDPDWVTEDTFKGLI